MDILLLSYIAAKRGHCHSLKCWLSATVNSMKLIDVKLFSHRSGQRWPWAAWWVWRVYPAPDGGRGPAVLSWRRRGRWCSASARAPACSLESSPPSRATGRWLPPPERGTVWRSAPGGCPINRQQLNAWQFDNRDQNNSGGEGGTAMAEQPLLFWCCVLAGLTCVCTDDTAWTSRLKSPLWLSIHLTGGACTGHF